jgi:PPOX class probable F420-dependent enzyme
MSQQVARQQFAAARIARLATVDGSGAPHLVPITFAVLDSQPVPDQLNDLIVFAVDHKPKTTTALRRLENIAAEPRISFLVDRYEDDWSLLWWVRADAAGEILDGAVRDLAINALCSKYVQYQQFPLHDVVVGGRVTKWVGWQAAPDGAGFS